MTYNWSLLLSPFLKTGVTCASFHWSGKAPIYILYLDRSVNDGANSSAHSLRTRGDISSSPNALLASSLDMSLIGASFHWSGKAPIYILYLDRSVNDGANSSAHSLRTRGDISSSPNALLASSLDMSLIGASFHWSGKAPIYILYLDRSVNDGANSSAHSLRTRGDISSGPNALLASSLDMSLITSCELTVQRRHVII